MSNKMKLRSLKTMLAPLLCCSVLSEAAIAKAGDAKPNVIIIFNDDQGYQDLGCFGSPDIKTPRIDQMAREGMKMTHFYVASNTCSASRAALMTGCYPFRVGVSHVLFPNHRTYKGLDPKHLTIAEVLKGAGYTTKAVGKWHLGDQPQYLPTHQGFDSYFGIPFSNDMYPIKDADYAEDCHFTDLDVLARTKAHHAKGGWANVKELKDFVPVLRNEKVVEFPCDQTTITRRYADESIQFINECAETDQPFFLYLANSMPHAPLSASPAFKGKSAGGLYGDVIEEIDFNTGRVLDALRANGLEENTIVILTSDNGPALYLGENGGHALPLFEGKGTSFEGGQRVPMVIKWPKKIPAGSVCDEMATTMDLLPTLAAISGAEYTPVISLDGKNITDLITAQPGAETPYDYFFYLHNAVRSGDWKYHKTEVFRNKLTKRESAGGTLYNLKDDIGETRNVVAEHPEIAARLCKALDAYIQQTPEPTKNPKSNKRK